MPCTAWERASGFSERTDPAALVIGPTGVALSPNCGARDAGECDAGTDEEADRSVLYVADTLNNRIAVIGRPLKRSTSAGSGETLSSGGSLNSPLGLVTTPNGHLLTVNGGDGFITEITPRGQQVAKVLLDNTGGPPPGGGTLFGLVFDPNHGVYFVDDGTNTLNLLH
jgi:DNA-binding beta-propeller fold protein YncE